MKKQSYFFFALLGILMGLPFITTAQKISQAVIPSTVLEAFKNKFPKVKKVVWEMESQRRYEAEFKLGGMEHSAEFDETGKWLGTAIDLPASKLPTAVKTEIKKHYPGFKLDEITLVNDPDKGVQYKVDIEKQNLEYRLTCKPDGEIAKVHTETEIRMKMK
ncbi:MAG TPA: PepSY-like domain-containing protein [Saprospiraceae bacterium]|nr:PepSY-like domain-containing protein [Saprospiraceae bacterium]